MKNCPEKKLFGHLRSVEWLTCQLFPDSSRALPMYSGRPDSGWGEFYLPGPINQKKQEKVGKLQMVQREPALPGSMGHSTCLLLSVKVWVTGHTEGSLGQGARGEA